MKATVIEDAPVLIPNNGHKNFTRSDEVIKQGTAVQGTIKVIRGVRRGEPFDYKLFHVQGTSPTEKGKLIYLKKIKPMNATEVKLGADSSKSATTISLPSVSNLGWRPVVCTLAGGGLAYWYAKKHGKHKHAFAIVGGVVGFIAGKYWQSHNKVIIQPSK